MDTLYHYGSNRRGFGILSDRAIRMSDIRKSNDYDELTMFYPGIFDTILSLYRKDPFEFKYEKMVGEDALIELLSITEYMISQELEEGSFSNFVVCFSEEPDLLSQWRGYANDAKGVCLGFSKSALLNGCKAMNGIIRLEKVNYITDNEREQILLTTAREAIENLRLLRSWIVENMTNDDQSPDTDGLLMFNFMGAITGFLTDSLRYKRIGFHEEKEWRLFFSDRAYKKPEWVLGSKNDIAGHHQFAETISFLRNQIKFNITEDNLSLYISLPFSKFDDGLITEIWLGPKSRISTGDLELFLACHDYKNVSIHHSNTSYR